MHWAILGTGQPKYHKLLQTLAERFPQKVALRLEFSNPLAHRIEAGADIFLMPSRFEPCGLNQIYSLKYGTVPLVRATGGLADTITGYDPQSPNPAANGFVFQEYSPLALSECLRQACDTYQQPDAVAAIGRHGHASGLVVGPKREEIRGVVSKTMEQGGATPSVSSRGSAAEIDDRRQFSRRLHARRIARRQRCGTRRLNGLSDN